MKLIVHLDYDPDCDCPADSDCAWKLYSFNPRHSSYKHPQDLELGRQAVKDGPPQVLNPGLRKKLQVGLAHFLSYYEHGDCLWFRKDGLVPFGADCPWDCAGLAGLLVWEHPAKEMGAKSFQDRAKDADGFLKSYTAWANGEAYWYSVEEADGTLLDSCGGFLDVPYLLERVRAAVKGRPYDVRGKAAGLMANLRGSVPV